MQNSLVHQTGITVPAVPSNNQIVFPQITFQQPFGSFQNSQPVQQNTVGPQLYHCKGMDGAKCFPTVPNSEIAIFDEDDDVMYIKETDKNNYPVSLRRFRFVEEEEVIPEYVTKKEYDSLMEEFKKLKEEIGNGKQFIQKSTDDGQSDVGTTSSSKPANSNRK